MHRYVCEVCGKTKTCTIAGCQGQLCVPRCVKCIVEKTRKKK